MRRDSIDSFYEALTNIEGIHGVILFKGTSVLKSSLENKATERFISFAEEIFNRARRSLSRLPNMSGEINFITIYLRNNIVLLAKYEELGLILIARVEKSEPTIIDKVIQKISEIMGV